MSNPDLSRVEGMERRILNFEIPCSILDIFWVLSRVLLDMDDKVNAEITKENGVVVVAFKTPSISSVEGINVVSSQIKDFIDKNRPDSLVFDFEGVRFFSSQVLGLLLDVRSKLKKYNGNVVISAINPRLHRVFKITNLDKIFTFFPDKDSAVKAARLGTGSPSRGETGSE